MSNSSEISDERNWYKISTIILSVAMVVLTFLSVVYYRYLDARRTDIAEISGKIESFTTRREELARVPKILVKVETLKDSGLPESAFSRLPTVPAVISVRHVGGETARGITVRVSSETKIVQVLPEESVESFSHSLFDDAHTIVFQIPQLRQESAIRATLMQRGLGAITHLIRVDIGRPIKRGDLGSLKSGLIKKIGVGFLSDFFAAGEAEMFPRFRREELGLEDIRDLDPNSFDTVAAIDEFIEKLKALRRNVANKSIMDFGAAPFMLAAIISAAIAIALMTIFELVNRGMRRHVVRAIRQQRLQPGMSSDEAEAVLGRWYRSRFTVAGKDDVSKCWFYPPQRQFLGIKGSPGCFVFLKNDLVQEVVRIQ